MKKGLAAILALTMTMGMTVPAMAAQPTREEALECFELTTSVDDETNGQGVFVKTEEPFRLGDFDQDLPPEEYYDFGSGDYKFTEYDSYNAIRQDSKIRLKNTAPKGKNVYLTASMQCYVDKYYGEDTPEDIPEYNPNVPIFFNGASADFTDTPIITLEDGTYIYLETVGYQLAEDGFVPSYRGEWIEI